MAAQMGGSTTSSHKQMAQERFDNCKGDIAQFHELGGMDSIAVLEKQLPIKICGYVKQGKEYLSAETGFRYLVEKVEYEKGVFMVHYRGRSGSHRGVKFHATVIDFLAVREDGSPAFTPVLDED